MEILKVQNLCKTYGTGEAKVDALKNVSFSLANGFFVLLSRAILIFLLHQKLSVCDNPKEAEMLYSVPPSIQIQAEKTEK